MQLFLLHPNFVDAKIDDHAQRYYCPHCALIEGILHYYPSIRNAITVNYVDFIRPRQSIIALIGEENQSCPVLILDKEEASDINTSYFKNYKELFFINSTELIARFFSERFGVAQMHP